MLHRSMGGRRSARRELVCSHWLGAVLIAASFASSGCGSGADERPPPPGEPAPSLLDRQAPGPTSDQPECEDWSTQKCAVEVARHADLVDCAQGAQVCEAGHWGDCAVDPSLGLVT